jgi:hypothetical protein
MALQLALLFGSQLSEYVRAQKVPEAVFTHAASPHLEDAS